MSADIATIESLLPPHSDKAEQEVLGAILFNQNAIIDVVGILGPEDFYRGPHQRIYNACLELFRKGEPVDLVFISEWLRDQAELESVGGVVYLMDLAASVTTALAIRYHAEIVKGLSVRRRLQEYAQELIHLAQTDSDGEAISYAQSELIKIATELDGHEELSTKALAQDALNTIKHRLQNPDEIRGLSTGLKTLDKMLCGLQPQKLIILGARPAMGKSGLALNMAVHVALVHKRPVLFYSLEMSPQEMIERALVGIAESTSRVDLLENASRLLTENLKILDTPNLTTAKLRASIIKHKLLLGEPGLILVDYLQLMKGATVGKGPSNRAEEISTITRELKLLSREFDVPMVVLSQLSRRVEERQDKRPMNSDLRDSGAIEQDADVVMFIYRDEYYNPDSDKRGLAEIIIGKNRGGQVGSFELLFRPSIVKFFEKVGINVF